MPCVVGGLARIHIALNPSWIAEVGRANVEVMVNKGTTLKRDACDSSHHPCYISSGDVLCRGSAVSYTHLTLPTNREV